MDNATHAFAGLLFADATVAWVERRSGVSVSVRTHRIISALGVIAAELPDIDLVYSGPLVGLGNLGYLLHHRGHTHTIVFAILSAVLLWWIALAFLNRTPDPDNLKWRLPLLALALTGTLSHLALDFTNSYGVHPFWPLNNQWVYGDAVFIVEPWLWVVAIPPLLLGRRRWWSRAVLSLLLVIILVAAWTLGEVARPLAVALVVFALAWLTTQSVATQSVATQAMASPYSLMRSFQVRSALIAWCVVELVFGVSSLRARALLERENPMPTNERIVDIVRSPEAGNPWCFSAIVVSITDSAYHVRTATVAPWTHVRSDSPSRARLCRSGRRRTQMTALSGAVSLSTMQQPHVMWGEYWSASRAEPTALARTRCEFAEAMHFMRVPVWTTEVNGTVHLSDLRFGVGTTGFSDVTVAAGPCPIAANAWIPPWVPPRADVLLPN